MAEENKVRGRLRAEDDALYARFRHAEEELRKLLEYSQGGGHLGFTPHGLSHVATVEKAYDWLLDDGDIEGLNPAECYCLLVATVLHDALMIPRKTGEEARARDNHATSPKDYLLQHGERLGINRHEAHAIGEVIRGHHVESIQDIPERTVIGNATIDLRKLGACLSVADISHADSSRAPQIVFDYLSLDEESARHWRKHLDIGGVTRPPGSDQVLISALTFSDEGAQAVEEYADEIRQQLKVVDPFFTSELLEIRSVELDITRLSSPVDRDLSFKTDMSSVLKILIEGVYERSDVFIRELVQNALDATYLRAATAMRKAEAYEPLVCVTSYHADDGSCCAVRVDDNGTGMDITQVQDMLLLIGGTSTDSASVRKLLEETTHKNLIATFGIGLLSCLKVASRIVIDTARSGSTPLRLELIGIDERIVSSEGEPQAPGTSIYVELAESFQTSIDPLASCKHYLVMVQQAGVQYQRMPVGSSTAGLPRDTVMASAATEGISFPSPELGPVGRTDIGGDDYQGWIWFPEDESELAPGQTGEVIVLNDGVYVATDPSDKWLPKGFHLCDGLLNFSARSVDLPVSRDRVMQNERLEKRREELKGRTARALETLSRLTQNPIEGDWAALLVAAIFRDASMDDRKKLIKELDDYCVNGIGSKNLTLGEIHGKAPDVVYAGYPQGSYVQELTRFDGKLLFHKEDDIVSLQTSWLSQQGKLVIDARRGGRQGNDLKEVDVITAYLESKKIRTIDLNEELPVQGQERSRPLPRESRSLVGASIKFVEFPGLANKRGWRIGSETWLNLAHPDIALCYDVLSNYPETAAAANAAVLVKLAALDFEGARVALVQELRMSAQQIDPTAS